MTAFHVGTYLQMGDDFDSRNRFLKIRADGTYEGCIVGGTGEAWSVNAERKSVNVNLSIRFRMGDYSLDVQQNSSALPYLDPTGTTTYVSSE